MGKIPETYFYLIGILYSVVFHAREGYSQKVI